jgi:malto-oligosyltrehalose trehalohydrolase
VPTTARRLSDVWPEREDLVAFAAHELPPYLMRQRWYPAKDAGQPSVTLTALIPLNVPQLPAAIAIWTAQPPGRDPLRLFLPIGLFPEGQLADTHPAVIGRPPSQGGVLADAFAADAFVRAFVRLIVDAATVSDGVQPGRTAHVDDAKLAAGHDWRIRRGTAEQSNTSIRIGDGAILKVIRKLEHGAHPELEMGRFLTEQAHFRATPALLGWIDLDGSTLAILQAFIPNDGDGWRETIRLHRMPQGAELLRDGVRFRLWAPRCDQVRLALHAAEGAVAAQMLPMLATGEGWHELIVPDAGAGTRYRFVLPDGMQVPDPASRYQPDDVHGPSEVIDPARYAWADGAWAGRPWHEAVVYELHVGAFTPAGTFRAAIERLDYLVALGVTAIEIMPIADFPGKRNWGYDGVLMYAPDSSYGRPEDLKALVDAAHARGIMVLLDVVYNHFGPDGNYLPSYAPAFFTDRHHTPWGAAVNFDGQQSHSVREFIIHNALYWMEEYHFDGLRLDAVHAILDDGIDHLLDELAQRMRAGRRSVHLVLENEENQVSRLLRAADGTPLQYTAQWNDDAHHVLHVAATGEATGYYREYLGDTDKLGRALAEGFAFQGQIMRFRGTPRGEPSGSLPPTAFVAFIQNHDQIGNRAFGERITALASSEALRAIVAVYLLLPQIPMLFMGEEWGAAQPFPFFCDFGGALADAVRKGRREEFAKAPEFQDEAMRQRIPDPLAQSTFESAKLAWSDLDKPEHAAWHAFYARLLETRRAAVVPLLPLIEGNAGRYEVLGPAAVIVRWRTGDGRELMLAANLSANRTAGFPRVAGRILWQEGEGIGAPWSVCWTLAQVEGSE